MIVATLPEAVKGKLGRVQYTWRIRHTHTHIFMRTYLYEKTSHTSLSPVQVQKECSYLTLITQKGQQEKMMLKSGKFKVCYIRGLLFYNLHTTKISSAYAA